LKIISTRIAFKMLPETFQDAVTIIHAVGIRYLWIGSLCVLQDDKKDWLQESAQIGSIYERAHLTIAASDAIDSTEGCFISRRPDLSTAEIPYYSDVEDTEGSIYISALPPHEPNPAWGPLRAGSIPFLTCWCPPVRHPKMANRAHMRQQVEGVRSSPQVDSYLLSGLGN